MVNRSGGVSDEIQGAQIYLKRVDCCYHFFGIDGTRRSSTIRARLALPFYPDVVTAPYDICRIIL